MKIVIVGGGTAGWLAALHFSKIKPEHNVTCIESSKIGIIGAGEGSTGTLTEIIQNRVWDFGCDEQDFVKECDATIKYGIKHIGWSSDKDNFYYGPIDSTPTGMMDMKTGMSYPQYDFIFQFALGYLNQQDLHIATELGYKIQHQKNDLENIGEGDHAYHFDAHKLGKYLKKVCDNVVHIDSEVKEVNLHSETGFITSVLLSDLQEIHGDLFIDASGFSQVLMKHMNSKWKSYKNHLPVNTALPFLLPYTEDEVIEPVTIAWAQNNGWCWQIPTIHRRGCGYVFSDEFVTVDQAHSELEQTIGCEVEPINHIKFESGRQEKLWIKNCVSIGLCAAFSEPLEATSIHTTIIQLREFISRCLNNTNDTIEDICNESQVDSYNSKQGDMYDTLKDFLVAHYTCGRRDTEFWKKVNNGSEFVRMVHELCENKFPDNNTFPKGNGYAGWSLWSYVLAGTGALTSEIAREKLSAINNKPAAEMLYNQFLERSKMVSDHLKTNTEVIKSMQKI
tara:strand:+ start:112 stop:1629 length:1518 start_codon:yes stop_codon:yes gene_type:complete